VPKEDEMRSAGYSAWIIALVLLTWASLGSASEDVLASIELTNEDCAVCHAGDEPEVPAVTDSILAASSHAEFACLDCHTDIDDIPHEDAPLARVDCGECHADETETYTHHGRGILGTTEDLPACADCHGTHEILPSSNRDSSVHPIHLSNTCGTCHRDLDLMKKHEIQLKRPVEVYESSVHGKAALGGIYVAATCSDCHSTGGTAHKILGPGEINSTINHFNIPSTCGQCHRGIEQDYWEGIHGKLAARGETDTPVCTDCHGEHGILRHDDPRSNVSSILVAESTCAPCHESARLNEKYGIPAGRLASFIDSFHGLKSKAGDPTVANCSSCHGAHRILPSSDPESSIHPSNLESTCGICHPNISPTLAQTKIHGTATGMRSGLSNIIAKIYIVAIVLIIGSMVVFVFLDMRKHIKDVNRKPQVRRMNANALFQHSILLISFSVLVVTGFALRYSEAWLFTTLFGWDGGFGVRGVIHRGAAVLFVFSVFWHALYLRGRDGSIFRKGMWPSVTDITQFWHTILFNVGRRRDKPMLGRFSYMEKAEYWALVWGSVVMIITGFFLWFDNLAVRLFPKGFLDVMLVIHLYEAWLATLAIAIWHLYGTVFRPGVYPGNPSWVTGKMPKEMYEEEHPGEAGIQGVLAPAAKTEDGPVSEKDDSSSRLA
jgi:cytochrome b subunit of formate dehydrogenase